MQLLSVQIATPRNIEIGSRTISTGIYKTPVETAEIRDLGLVDDTIVNGKHHGGLDQAVYIYSDEDYLWWRSQLGEELPPGTFGENLTFDSFGSDEVRIGDRWHIGDVVLETSAPRLPCATLASRMSDGSFVKRFRAARRPGFYTRVIAAGTVSAGMDVTRIPSTSSVTLMDVYDLAYDTGATADRMRRALAAPIAIRGRDDLERRLSKLV